MKKTNISEKAVQEATGKVWEEWFTFIEGKGGKNLSHKEIVALLKTHTALSAWWQQSVTVEYEIARGKRKAHEMLDGFQISKSQTLSAEVEEVYRAWIDAGSRASWLEDPTFTIRKENKEKSLRITWVDDQSHVDVYFYPKGSKTQVTINHGKLADSAQAEKMKIYWHKQLLQLAKFLD